MSKDMGLVIKEKYSNFIKIIDSDNVNYVNNSENTDKSNKFDKSDKSNSKEFTDIFSKLETIINSNSRFTIQNTQKEILNVKKSKFKEKSKYTKSHKTNQESDEENQIQKLEIFYEQEINKPQEEIQQTKLLENEVSNLKDICYKFEDQCIMESTRGFNVQSDLYYINLSLLVKNLIEFNKKYLGKYSFVCFYRVNYAKSLPNNLPDKIIEWKEISSNGENSISSKNKFLSTCIRLLETGTKFKKTIHGTKTRGFKLTFLVCKTNYKIDIFALGKELK